MNGLFQLNAPADGRDIQIFKRNGNNDHVRSRSGWINVASEQVTAEAGQYRRYTMRELPEERKKKK